MPKYNFTNLDSKPIVLPENVTVTDVKDVTHLQFHFPTAQAAKQFSQIANQYMAGEFQPDAKNATVVSIKKNEVRDPYCKEFIAYCEKQKNKSLLIATQEEAIAGFTLAFLQYNLPETLQRLPIEQHKDFLKVALNKWIISTNDLRIILDKKFPALKTSLETRNKDHKQSGAAAVAVGSVGNKSDAKLTQIKNIFFLGAGQNNSYVQALADKKDDLLLGLMNRVVTTVGDKRYWLERVVAGRINNLTVETTMRRSAGTSIIVFCPAKESELEGYVQYIQKMETDFSQSLGCVVILDKDIFSVTDGAAENFKKKAAELGLRVIEKPTAENRDEIFTIIEQTFLKPRHIKPDEKVVAQVGAKTAAYEAKTAAAAAYVPPPETNPGYVEPVSAAAPAQGVSAVAASAPPQSQVISKPKADISAAAQWAAVHMEELAVSQVEGGGVVAEYLALAADSPVVAGAALAQREREDSEQPGLAIADAKQIPLAAIEESNEGQPEAIPVVSAVAVVVPQVVQQGEPEHPVAIKQLEAEGVPPVAGLAAAAAAVKPAAAPVKKLMYA